MKKGFIELQILQEANPNIELAIANPVDPKEFFTGRYGLYVSEGFNERVMSSATKLEASMEYRLESLDLVRDAKDEEIELSLSKKNVFEVNDACAIIGDLISKQAKGEDGILLTNGYSNLFYTPACVVDVHWDGPGWYVYAWPRGGFDWAAGLRVFSPQLTLDLSTS